MCKREIARPAQSRVKKELTMAKIVKPLKETYSKECSQQNVTKLHPSVCLAFKRHALQTHMQPAHRTARKTLRNQNDKLGVCGTYKGWFEI